MQLGATTRGHSLTLGMRLWLNITPRPATGASGTRSLSKPVSRRLVRPVKLHPCKSPSTEQSTSVHPVYTCLSCKMPELRGHLQTDKLPQPKRVQLQQAHTVDMSRHGDIHFYETRVLHKRSSTQAPVDLCTASRNTLSLPHTALSPDQATMLLAEGC